MTLVRLRKCAEWIEREYSDYTLVDVGCRTKELQIYLKRCSSYFGTDIQEAPGVFKCDLRHKLPIESFKFDISVALDVLEHLDDPHLALSEIKRISRIGCFVSLPNMYYWKFRLRFLLGFGLSGKYKFEVDPVIDRHRWMPSASESIRFIEHNSSGFSVKYIFLSKPRGRLAFLKSLDSFLASTWPNIFAYGVLFHLKRLENTHV